MVVLLYYLFERNTHRWKMHVVGHIAGQSILYCTFREQTFFKSLIESMVNIKDYSTEGARKLKLPKNRSWLGRHHMNKKPV